MQVISLGNYGLYKNVSVEQESFNFFSTDSSSHGRGRTTPSFYTGSIKSVRSNKSASPSTGTMDQEMRNVSVNPVFKDDNKPDQLWLSNSSQMRARGLIFEQ